MSQDMSSSSSWRTLSASAASRFTALKGYVAPQDLRRSIPQAVQRQGSSESRQGWREWAGQKISARKNPGTGGMDRIALFPGWAARRYPDRRTSEDSFDVEVYVSGFATTHRLPELATRSQKAFMRLAKGFAGLPKLDSGSRPSSRPPSPPPLESEPMSKSTEDLLANIQLPPRPMDISDDYDVQALEKRFREIAARDKASPTDETSSVSSESSRSSESNSSRSTKSAPSSANPLAMLPEEIQKLHANLEARLNPFWSSVIANRPVRIHLFASPHGGSTEADREAIEYGPILTKHCVTATDGSFEVRFKVRWEDMCQHPGALHIAFGEARQEHDLLVVAEVYPEVETRSREVVGDLIEPVATTIRIPLTHADIRVISDIDDTVKHSNVLGGARTIFHNVFVKDLTDLVLPGIGEWYTDLWRRGIRFHYVSNGPFEMLPILSDFFQIAHLPPGSIKLKSYAGRSLFSGLLSAPASRKRAGVLDILNSLPASRFILIGDTGEQDMELYAEIARDRPHQILGVFVRHVDVEEALEDPTGEGAISRASTPLRSAPTIRSTLSKRSATDPVTPEKAKFPPQGDYFTSNIVSTEPEQMSTPKTSAMGSADPIRLPVPPPKISRDSTTTQMPPSKRRPPGPLLIPEPPAEQATPRPIRPTLSNRPSFMKSKASSMSSTSEKMYDLQLRVYRARAAIPAHIPLRVFRNPEDCAEVEAILTREGL